MEMKNKRVISEENEKEFRHVHHQDNIWSTPDGSETLLDLFLHSCNTYSNNNYLGTIVKEKVIWQTYKDVLEKVKKLSVFFNKFTEKKDIIGIFSVNRYEWLVSEYAGYMSSCVNCPLYSTYGPDAIALVLNETEMKICCVSYEKAKSLYEIIKEYEIIHLKDIVIFDECESDNGLVTNFESIGINVHYWDQIMKKTDFEELRTHNLIGDDLATICYTSGTTASPKGVMLSHKNFISTVASFIRGSSSGEMFRVSSDDVYLSYLPLAHVMERVCVSIISSYGASIGFYRGNPKTIKDDYVVIRPTFIAAVPRVLNLFKEKIEAKVNSMSFMKRWLFKLALKYKEWRLSSGVFDCWLLDTLIFNKVKREFGGRIKAILCGAAPLTPSVCSFIQGSLCVHVFQGYGQTETTGATTLKPMDCFDFDTIGIPFPTNRIKLVPVSGYGDDCGEVFVKGSNVTKGYFKREEETKNVFDKEGWLMTGDIARCRNGYFNIVGRRKEMFKNSCGEFIIPEKIENLFSGDIIQDMFVTKALCNDRIIAIVVCQDEKLDEYNIQQYIAEKGNQLVEQRKIARYEIPKHLILIRNGFDTFKEQDFLTPTAKKKRNNLEKYFKDSIAKIQSGNKSK